MKCSPLKQQLANPVRALVGGLLDGHSRKDKTLICFVCDELLTPYPAETRGIRVCLLQLYILVFCAGLMTVMCYNVLCDKYATRQMYGYCPSWALTWEYRKKSILTEIRHYTADIISLQVRK